MTYGLTTAGTNLVWATWVTGATSNASTTAEYDTSNIWRAWNTTATTTGTSDPTFQAIERDICFKPTRFGDLKKAA